MCRRLMTTPGVGPVVALTFRATVDVPARFRKSKAVGAVFGLTCAKYQSGEVDRSGRISRCGDEMMRVMLYEAAQSMLRSKNSNSVLSQYPDRQFIDCTATPCDGHHEMSDLGAAGEPVHSDAASVQPVWPHQRLDGPRWLNHGNNGDSS